VDKTALNTKITEAQGKTESNYTTASWSTADLANVITAAQTVAASDNATISDVADAISALETAIGALVEKADSSALYDKLTEANSKDEDDYTPTSWAASEIEGVIAAAQEVYDDDESTEDEIAAAISALNDAIEALVEKATNKDELLTAINNATAKLDEEDAYTPTSWDTADLANAIAAAQEVYDDEDATTDDVVAAIQELSLAEDQLDERADNSELLTAISNATELLEKEDDYTPNSWEDADLEATIEAAQAVADDGDASEDDIEAAIASLSNAIDALAEKANKGDLEDAIDTLPEIEEEDATSVSWSNYTDKLEEAQEVFEDPNATQDEVDDAESALRQAIEGVELLPDCDYDDLNDAIADYEEIEDVIDTNYTPESVSATDVKALYQAAKEVNMEMLDDEAGVNQGIIDAAASALSEALGGLVPKADKTALATEIAGDPTLTEDIATKDSWDNYTAVLAEAQEVYDDDNATEEEVADAITDLAAAKTLTSRGLCNYDALNTALGLTPELDEEAYTTSSWKAYSDAKTAAVAIDKNLVDNKAGTNQASITDAAEKLTTAFNALAISKSNIVSAEYAADTYYAKGTMTYTFKINGAATKIQVIAPNGATQTYDRYHAKVAIKSFNAQGQEVDYATEEPAYETWTLDLNLAAGNYKVIAKYGKVWDKEGLELNLEYATYTPAISSGAAVGGEQVSKTIAINAKRGSAVTFTVTTPKDVMKLQLALANGKTSTYTTAYAVEQGDNLVWTITRTFRSVDVGECTIKAKTLSGWTTPEGCVYTIELAQ
ncbi:MAG TPA: hypothetical protein DDY98_09130, partial [Ruminococcaceae bacterium]|nr:hypothetical protein [Oscillospiraceae bacterium]